MSHWISKKTMAEKHRGRRRAEVKRRLFAPTMSELREGGAAEIYCKERGLSADASKRVIALVRGLPTIQRDWRDHRSIPKKERVPRSLEWTDSTPPRFWEVFI